MNIKKLSDELGLTAPADELPYEQALDWAVAKIEAHPDYSFLAARIRLAKLKEEVEATLRAPYIGSLPKTIRVGIAESLYDERMATLFDLETLSNAIRPERDNLFDNMGASMLVDRYLLRNRSGKVIELPQVWWMRVAMGQCLEEEEPTERAIELYNMYSQLRFVSSTPTLFNSGTTHPQMSSCYLSTVSDDLEAITRSFSDIGSLSKHAGGQALDVSSIRGEGAYIAGTNGRSRGGSYWWKIVDGLTAAVSQGSKREGALVMYLEPWHIDVFSFIRFRSTTQDETISGKFSNTAIWTPDLFMERAEAGDNWWLFSPDKTPDLHDLYGIQFREAYEAYEAKAESASDYLERQGDTLVSRPGHPLHPCRRIPAMTLAREWVTHLFKFGNPWFTFKDAANIRNPQKHVGVIHSSNLCTEITLNTEPTILNRDRSVKKLGETAVCNLASINLPDHIVDGKLDRKKIRETVKVAIRALDNVITLNYYPIPEARNSNLKHRPIGLGIMGFHDALFDLSIPYDSDEAVEFSDVSSEVIMFEALRASCELAKERGAYETFEGSSWSKGMSPLDSLKELIDSRSFGSQIDTSSVLKEEWGELMEEIVVHGLRNSVVMAIAPTASIGNIAGLSNGVDPWTRNIYTKENLSGHFLAINRRFVLALEKLGLWNEETLQNLKADHGSARNLDIPQHLKDVYKVAQEINPMRLIECNSRRQKWIDQSISLNIYAPDNVKGSELWGYYVAAWKQGLKTTYYLKARSHTQREAIGVDSKKQQRLEQTAESRMSPSSPKVCLISDPSCESCQ